MLALRTKVNITDSLNKKGGTEVPPFLFERQLAA
jgi:hypothetical protein